jgi:hypothetical protein
MGQGVFGTEDCSEWKPILSKGAEPDRQDIASGRQHQRRATKSAIRKTDLGQ